MADYTSKYYGAEIDSAVGTALALKDLRGIIKITADGPVAAVANEDYIADSSSIVNVAGILKGVADAKTGKIVVHKAEAGIDYQTPLKAGIDYATPTAVANKQNKINSVGLLKCTGEGVVTTAKAGTDYATPEQAKVFLVTFTKHAEYEGLYVSDKTITEILTACNEGKVVIGTYNHMIYRPTYSLTSDNYISFTCNYAGVLREIGFSSNENQWYMSTNSYQNIPDEVDSIDLVARLVPNVIYNITSPVTDYTFNPPEIGWAHGKFTTGSSASVSFAGTFLGAVPTIEASKTYEFDVLNGVWAVQEVVSA